MTPPSITIEVAETRPEARGPSQPLGTRRAARIHHLDGAANLGSPRTCPTS